MQDQSQGHKKESVTGDERGERENDDDTRERREGFITSSIFGYSRHKKLGKREEHTVCLNMKFHKV